MCAHNLNDVTFAEEAQFILGCYYYNSYHDVIEKNVNRAINCLELSGYHYAPANWFLARHFEHQGDYMQAFNYLTKAKSMDPPMDEMPIEIIQEANAFESPEDWYENKTNFLLEKSSEKRKKSKMKKSVKDKQKRYVKRKKKTVAIVEKYLEILLLILSELLLLSLSIFSQKSLQPITQKVLCS